MSSLRINSTLREHNEISIIEISTSLSKFLENTSEEAQSLAKQIGTFLQSGRNQNITKFPNVLKQQVEEHQSNLTELYEIGSSIFDERTLKELDDLYFITTSLLHAMLVYEVINSIRLSTNNFQDLRINFDYTQTNLVTHQERMVKIKNTLKKQTALSLFIDCDLFIKLNHLLQELEEISAIISLQHGAMAIEWANGVLKDYRKGKDLGLDLIRKKQIDLSATKKYLNKAKKDIDHKIKMYHTLIEDSDESLRHQLKEQMKTIQLKLQAIERIEFIEQKNNEKRYKVVVNHISRFSIFFWQVYNNNKDSLIKKKIREVTFPKG